MFTTTNPARKRRPFYDRGTPEAPLAITPRDIDIFRNLATHRFMSTRELQALFGVLVERRLRTLFRHGYVDRPEAQHLYRRFREGGGSNPGIYALDNPGAEVLRGLGLLADNRDWTECNRELSPITFLRRLPHDNAVADVRLAFCRAVEERPELRLVLAEELARGKDARALAVPGGRRAIVPDWIFAVARDGAPEPSLFFLEVDRGTEPNVRHGSEERQSIKRKYDGYLAYARSKRVQSQFGVGNFRVLTITTGGPTKVGNLVEVAREVTDGTGAGRFLATNVDAFSQSDPLELSWMDAGGQAGRITL